MDGKYVVRRFLLVLTLLALVVGGGVYLGYYLGHRASPPAPVTEPTEPTPAATTAPAVTTAPAPTGTPVVRGVPLATEPTEPPVTLEIITAWNLLLVNKQNHLPENFDVELEKVSGDFRVDARIRDTLLRMMAHAREDGITLLICSAYRSPEYQTTLFENKKAELMQNGMAESEAIQTTATIITHPGTSEHHTGLAVDIVTPEYQGLDSGFENTPAFQWLSQNGAKYGFILRYPKDKQDITDIIYEPWHYRYVGEEHAAAINEQKLCLEEYVEQLYAKIVVPGTTKDTEDEAEDKTAE